MRQSTSSMVRPSRQQAEAIGARHDWARMLDVRVRTRDAIDRIAARVVPGMPEKDALIVAREVLHAAGMLRGWHAAHVRFGSNTLKPFGAPSEPGAVLGHDDIFFIDIGPVWCDWEGDGGDTFVVGNDPEMHRIATDVRAVFDAVRSRWASDGLTGEELYRFAMREAESLGWQLNLDMSGHRLSDFPHKLLHARSLAEAAFTPSPGLWVLEIQIRHPDRPFSAFYEDLLLDQIVDSRAP